MKYLKSSWASLRSNWFLVLLSASFAGYIWTSVEKIESVSREMANSRSLDSEGLGLAVYMQGSNCVIRATPDIPKQLFMDLAMSCAKKHEDYLETLSASE